MHYKEMPKMKTNKSVAKKVKITKNKKVLRRTTGQNHYNSKETGDQGRAKKKDRRLFKADEKNVVAALPYAIGK
jgi:ribosomal protein L35